MDVTIETSETGGVLLSRRVHLPVELGPGLHRRLTAWCRDTARMLDVGGLARTDVIEAMLEHLVENPAASAAVRAKLRAEI